MAEKRITTVEEVMAVDESADYVLIVRGTQKDVKRLLIRRIPQDFDVHDDVADELTTLAGIDRLVISDEGSPGAPQKFVRLSTLRSFFLDLFDLHDDVPTELTTAADEDRLLISDESENGDPQKFITAANLRSSLLSGVLSYQKLLVSSSDMTPTRQVVAHTLGKTPIGFQFILRCVSADQGFSVGDEVIIGDNNRDLNNNGTNVHMLHNATPSSITVTVAQTPNIFPKTSGGFYTVNASRWDLYIAIWG